MRPIGGTFVAKCSTASQPLMAARNAGVSNRPTSTGSAPSARTTSALAAPRATPRTRCPAALRARAEGRPRAPVAPARNTRIRMLLPHPALRGDDALIARSSPDQDCESGAEFLMGPDDQTPRGRRVLHLAARGGTARRRADRPLAIVERRRRQAGDHRV